MRGALKKELAAHLRRRQSLRRSRKASSRGVLRGQIEDAVRIRERPANFEDRGAWPLGGGFAVWDAFIPDRDAG